MLDSSVEEFSTPRTRLDGDGDGFRHVGARPRAGAPSSRKFGARTPPDEKVKVKLARAMEEERDKMARRVRTCCAAVQRARTVAEITPTKAKLKRRIAKQLPSAATLHATPRPLADASTTRKATPRQCRRPDAFCRVYQRLLLKAWRRQRGRLEESVAKNEKIQNQINQLELQVDFLKAMRNSECEKRNEAMSECQLFRKKSEVFETENSNLIKEVKMKQEELDGARKNFKLAKCDLKRSSEQVAKLQDQLRRRKEEKMDLLSKLAAHEEEIASQMSFVTSLKEKLRITEMNLQNSQVNLNGKQEALEEMIQRLRSQTDIEESLRRELASLRDWQQTATEASRRLEERLQESTSRCTALAEQSSTALRELLDVSLELDEERKRKWYRDAGEMAAASLLGAVARIVDALLPRHCRGYY